MQSYEHHIVYEALEMRHPYLQEPWNSDIDPNQVSRIAPRLRAIALELGFKSGKSLQILIVLFLDHHCYF